MSKNAMLKCDTSLYFGILWYWVIPWPTKYTTIYFTFWRPKLRHQFSENLVIEFPKKKTYGSSENWKFKIQVVSL